MLRSESITKLAPALVKANAEVATALKDSKNPHYGSTFASLNSVLDALKPVYAAHGLTVVQIPGMDGGNATLDTMIVHESGEWLSGVSVAPLPKKDPQGVGSAVTYLRRYALAALAGIRQDDDDGNEACKPSAEALSLAREVTELLERANGDLPAAGRRAAEEAVDQKDPARLRAALAWLGDHMEVAN